MSAKWNEKKWQQEVAEFKRKKATLAMVQSRKTQQHNQKTVSNDDAIAILEW
jgi:hypothetical protein